MLQPRYCSRDNGERAIVLDRGKYNGYKYVILDLCTHPCAYVEQKFSFDIANEIAFPHGGFSFEGLLSEITALSYYNTDETKWIGWDYAQYPDYVVYTPNCINRGKKWTTEEILIDVHETIDRFVKYQKDCKESIACIEPMFEKCKNLDVDDQDIKCVCLSLYNAGYCKADDLLKEFAEKLKDKRLFYVGHVVAIGVNEVESALNDFLKSLDSTKPNAYKER